MIDGGRPGGAAWRSDDATLGMVLEHLGATVLEVSYGRVDHRRPVSTAVIVDPFDAPVIPPNSIVLGVGVVGTDAILDLLEGLSEDNCVGLVLREPVGFHPAVAKAASDRGILILGLVRGVSWNQVAAAVTNLVAGVSNTASRAVDPVGFPAGDPGNISAVADAISVLLDAPITIEDLNSRIVAFSSNQNRGDRARQSSVLGQKVPAAYTQRLRELGVFKQVYANAAPVFLSDQTLSELPRAVMRVAAGDEILGSIWAVVSEPLTAERERTFVEAARLVALYLHRGRIEMDSERRSRQALLVSLLSGGEEARALARELDIDFGPFCVIAIDLAPAPPGSDSVDAASRSARLTQVVNAVHLQLAGTNPSSLAGVVGDVVYGLLPLRAGLESPASFVKSLAQDFHDRSMRRERLLIAVGTIVEDAADLQASRRDADRALRVIRNPKTSLGRTVVRADEVQVDTVLLEVYDQLVREQRVLTGPVFDLIAFDRAHDTDFVPTLDAFLAAFGDITRAAAALHVHPNTCRYRLRRIQEISGLDVNDPEARFNAMLQLRVLKLQ